MIKLSNCKSNVNHNNIKLELCEHKGIPSPLTSQTHVSSCSLFHSALDEQTLVTLVPILNMYKISNLEAFLIAES